MENPRNKKVSRDILRGIFVFKIIFLRSHPGINSDKKGSFTRRSKG
jgi:hypothetical protein